MMNPTSESAQRRKSSRRLNTSIAIARATAVLLLIAITAAWGVATVVALEATRSLLWFGVFTATQPRHMPVPLFGHDAFWINAHAWRRSLNYGDMYVHVIVLYRTMWNARSPGVAGVVASVHFICAFWLFTLVIRYRARRVGLRKFSDQPSRLWLPTLSNTLRCFGRAVLSITALTIFIHSVTQVLYLCFYIGFAFTTRRAELWPDTWHILILRRFGDLSNFFARPQHIFVMVIAIGMLYSLLACERLARDAVRAEYRRTVRHCPSCGYPLADRGATCPECGPTAARVRGSRVDSALTWALRPPRRAFFQIAGMVLLTTGIEAAYFPILHRIRMSASPERPRPPLDESQLGKSMTNVRRNFDYLAQLRFDTVYAITIDGTSVTLKLHSPIGQAHYTQALDVTWTVDGGPVQTAHFPGYDPMRPTGGFQEEWQRVPAIFINDNVFFFETGANIVLEPGPDRVDVRIFADSVSIDLAHPTP